MMPYPPQAIAGPNVGPNVEGVPLEPGERVVYHVRPDYSAAKTGLLVFGILFLVVLVGIFFLFARGRIDQRNARALVVTTHRVIVVQGTGETEQMWLRDIAGFEAIRHRGRTFADRAAASDPRFWQMAIGFVLKGASGQTLTVNCQDRPKEVWEFGLYLARVAQRGSAEGMPPVQRL